MKKFLLTMVLVVASTGLASAQIHSFGQIALGFPSQTYQLSSTKVSLGGIGLAGSSFFGEDWGLLMGYGMHLVNSAKFDDYTVSMSDYDMHLAFDFLVGPGYRFVLGEKVTAIVGGGVHMGEALLAATYGGAGADFLVLSFGAGVSGSMQYMFAENFGVTGGLNLGYDFASGLLDAGNETFSSGLSVLPYVGFAFKS